MKLKHTTVKGAVDEWWEEKALVAALIPSLNWRWHGIGLLQAYVFEGDRELRVHVWSPALMLEGIAESGNAHNHRFELNSVVLLGELRHTEWSLTPDAQGDHELWDFPHARLQTDDTRSLMRRLNKRCTVRKSSRVMRAGERYRFERFAYHSTEPLTHLAVTLVQKSRQLEKPARVVAPVDVNPVPAFGGTNLEKRKPDELLERARAALLENER